MDRLVIHVPCVVQVHL